jgi:GTP 3',8-cyclase
MLDSFKRPINYLRISVTDRCNYRCNYCMPEEGVPLIAHQDVMRFEEIVEVVKEAVILGIFKFRITGGEPLVRKGIVELVDMIAHVEGVKDLGLTTNGVFLTKYAHELKKAGLMRINVSLDTLNPERFKEITRLGNIDNVLQGIQTAKNAGFAPIKINCVIRNSKNEPDALEVAEFCKNNGHQIRFIREMDLEKGTFFRVQGGDGGECAICNRLRLTADGNIKPCLFNDTAYNVRILGIREALKRAISEKPESGTVNSINSFNNIGG